MGSPAHPFLGALARGAIALDGAMGTALWARGVDDRRCLEELVLSRPELVSAIHEAHVAAGANAIETDTFGANRIRLDKHGLGDRVREINEAAVAIARRAAAGRAFVLGAIGPSSMGADVRARDAYAEQGGALVGAGVDALMLETFYRADDIELALECVRAEVGLATPIVAMVTVDAALEMFDKTSLKSIALRLARRADVVGVNCCDGPATALAAIEALVSIGDPLDAPIAVMPSAGLPRREGATLVFDASPEDFGAFARRARALGARLIGGCCGTTAEHVRRIAEALREGFHRGGVRVVTPLALRWTRAVPSLRDTGLRAAFMRNELQRYDLGAVAAAVDQLAGLAEQADPIAREVLAAIVLAFADGSLVDRVDALRARAATSGLLPLGRLLRRRPQREGVSESRPPDPAERALPRAPNGRALTLGERKSLARRSSRVALDRLLRDPHPDVIRNVLVNPRLTEDDVVRLAARRPAFPDVLTEIARHAEWSQRARVRRALVQNPFTPADVAVPLVRLLIRPELVEVLEAPSVPAIVRAAAKELLERRPPVPERRDQESERAPRSRSH